MLGVLQKLEEALSLAEDPAVISAIDGLKSLVGALHDSKTADTQSGGNGPPPHG